MEKLPQKWVLTLNSCGQKRTFAVEVVKNVNVLILRLMVILFPKRRLQKKEAKKHAVKLSQNIESETHDVDLERELKLIAKKYGERKLGSRETSRRITLLSLENVDTAMDDALIDLRNLTLCGTSVYSIFRPLIKYPDSKNFLVGEVKGEDVKDELYATLLDLIRIGRFLKQSVDSNFYEGTAVIYVINRLLPTLILGLLTKLALLYTMIESCILSMPRDAT
ncbi:MAG: hypothetical protein EXX96DRAFT_539004 [Benjaminiella poitrasii]|nr:MAG: hypothetical protein EXX96DRAFT_539004 [Benjaminiella poitrasii]